MYFGSVAFVLYIHASTLELYLHSIQIFQMSSLPYFIFFFLLPLASTFEHSCPDRCGKVPIRYPFGVGSDCSLDKSFNITCIDSKPYLNISNKSVEVVGIRPDNPPQIRVKYPHILFGVCYNKSSGNSTWSEGNDIELSESLYSLSADNWLTGIGCDDIVASSSYNGEQYITDACIGACSDGYSSSDLGSCPNNGDPNSFGEGCCRTPIPKGTSSLTANLIDINKVLRDTKRVHPCSYVFVKEKGIPLNKPGYEYPFSVLMQNSTAFLKNEQPVVRLDWRIGSLNCSEARRNSSYYKCRNYSDCVDFGAKIGGYFCNCSEGFAGNPYIGCIDINECVGKNPCGPHSTCKNSVGSFECLCKRGYNGDGRLNGSGCTRSKIMQIALIGLGAALGFILLVLLCLLMHRVFEKTKRRRRKEDLFKRVLLQQQTSEGTFGKTKLYTAKELGKATDSFNESRICGHGGQGVVYKGMLSDGTIVAIKKLKHVDEDQVEQFINEVVILSQINHKNVVRLLGCCLATEEPLLVYEFLPNGTLYDFIHVPKLEFPLTWDMRLKIAADVAGALAYLHSASSTPIYHRDIKSKNILLDEKYIVKVSDFGISKLVEVDQTHLTTLVKGTFGYLDPEYYQTSQYTDKSDVYSFGVVLVELLTGKRPISMERPEMERNLASHFLACMQENSLDNILDAQVSEQGEKEEVMAVAKLARRCLNSKGRMRPIMKEVATELESLRISQVPPIVNEEPEEARMIQGKHVMFSDVEYTWTVNDDSMSTSASAEHPLICEAV